MYNAVITMGAVLQHVDNKENEGDSKFHANQLNIGINLQSCHDELQVCFGSHFQWHFLHQRPHFETEDSALLT